MGMTIGPNLPLPPAMMPGVGDVGGKPGAKGVFGGRAVSVGAKVDVMTSADVRKSVAGSVRTSFSSVRDALGLAAVDAATEADITRNDALGKLFQRFEWPTPPMPEFKS